MLTDMNRIWWHDVYTHMSKYTNVGKPIQTGVENVNVSAEIADYLNLIPVCAKLHTFDIK